MEPLPEDVALSLLRGVSAYIRAMPTQELPPAVRRFQGFRASGLARHRDRILALLDDEPSRLRILEWLDEDKPPLSKDDVAVLRVAAAREDGWLENLTARSQRPGSVVDPGAPGNDLHEKALAREKEKLRKAKEESKRAREEATRELKAERATASALATENERLKRALEEAQAAAGAQAKRAEGAEEKAARELRRARKDAQEAERVADEARSELRALRKENADLERRLEELSKPKKKRAAGRSQTKPSPKGPRKPLAPPKGRYEDAPETLDEWLDTPDVHLVVDGYNVTKAEGGFGDLELPKQRDRLIQEVSKLARKKGATSTVVFDGTKVPPGTAKLNRGPARVEFSAEETADDHIVALLDKLPAHPVVVATNDRELQARVAAKGATVATSNQLLALLR